MNPLRLLLSFSLLLLASSVIQAESWNRVPIHDQFYSEGSSAGDIDGDGKVDLVAGPHWYRGPEFKESFAFTDVKPFSIFGYSDNFFSSAFDANNDQKTDILIIGFPGQAARLYLNPGSPSENNQWQMVEIAPIIDNESPAVVDLIPGGTPEIVCGRDSSYGYYQAGENGAQPWVWHPVSKKGTCGGRFAHALGVGDVNGDGRLDILDRTYWWEQPSEDTSGEWSQHQWALEGYGPGGAQIRVADLDGDGDQDLVSSYSAHSYGLGWFEQVSPDRFVRHDIMGASSLENDYGVSFSQLHAVELVDMNGDGLKDIVTGKRFYAHNGKDPGGLQEPVLYWFECKRNAEGCEFIPHLIDRNSGVGVDVLVRDLNADNLPDVVTSSKRGVIINFQNREGAGEPPQKWKLTEGRSQAEYVNGTTPEQAPGQFILPEGFSIDLVASEPELTQPIAMCFDARGRIWVIEGHTYPRRAPEGEGQDRVIILSDKDADGTFETKTTFIEGLNLASGIEVGFGGVWIGAAPYLLFIPDANWDDIPDSEPQVLLDGWGYQDTHETLNSFTWGPDGWLYGCHGVFTHSNVGKPGASDEQRERLNAAVWRYHPTAHQFEVFAHGTSNPWGVDFDDQGNWFITACVIPHLYHIQQGARYQRQAGQHFNPYTYDEIVTIADHAHYSGNIQDHAFWGANYVERRPAPLDTSMVGGGHAHCGLAIYNADVFPREFYGDLYFHNLHGHRVVRETLVRDGSGFVGKHRPDFALSRDHKEIGVGIMVGPDGALYTSDWHDLQTCHHRTPEIWDRTDGRMFRIRYGDVRPQRFNLWEESDEQLVERLKSPNGFFARQAQRILHERSAAGPGINSDAQAELAKMFSTTTSQRDRMRTLWTSWCCQQLDWNQVHQLLSHSDEYVRGWAVHFVSESLGKNETEGFARCQQKLLELARQDQSLVVGRYLASLLQRIPAEERWAFVEALTSQHLRITDRNIPFLVWYGFEPIVPADPQRAFQIANKSGWNMLKQQTVRRISVTPEGREVLASLLAQPGQAGNRRLILEQLVAAARSRGGVAMPASWPEAYELLVADPAPEVQNLTRSFAVQVGDQRIYPYFRNIFADHNADPNIRLEALAALRTARDPEIASYILKQLEDPAVRKQGIAALAESQHPETASKLIAVLPKLDAESQTVALGTLVSRKEWATALTSSMEQGEVAPESVPAFIIRQALSFNDQSLTKRLEKTWGRIAVSSEEMAAEYKKFRELLQEQRINRANAGEGRLLYEANCGKCHQLFGTGGKIGPDITGANRTQVNYWLENILEPNALIGRAYQVTTFVMVDGRVVSGIIQAQNEDAITVQTATEKVILPIKEIEEKATSNTSLMPQGQLQKMTDQQVLNLFKYLMSPQQVAKP